MSMQRIHSIDLLRGLSIVAVIILHINLNIPFDTHYLENNGFLSAIYKVIFWSGHYGVVTFFVISGFLITTTSIKRWGSLRNIPYQQFYLIRFARIMPCLIALLIILSILSTLGVAGFVIDSENTSLKEVVFSALTFHLNWLEAKTGYLPAPWGVLWSLSVEEAFYLFFPLVCIAIKSDRYFICLMLLFVILGPFSRAIFTQNDIWVDHAYLSCMDGIALGCLSGLWATQNKFSKSQLQNFMIVGTMLALFIILFRTPVYNLGLPQMGLSITILEVGISFILISLYQNALTGEVPVSKNMLIKILQWFGRNSYEVYLTHVFSVLLFAHIFYATELPFAILPIGYILILGASGLCGQLVARYYSIPMNKKILKTIKSCELSPLSKGEIL